MKTFIKFIAALFVLLLPIVQTEAQCPNNNTQFGTSSAPVTVGQLVTLSTCIYGGEYRLVNNLQAGSVYSFETCGDTDFDTQVTVYDASTNSLVAFNDDFCGLQSKVSFTSNGNAVRVLIDRFNCANQSSCMTLGVTRVTGAPTATPCSNVSPLNCGIAGSFNITGAGAWNNLGGPWSTPGEEQVFTFTPTLSGPHSIVVNHSSGYYVDLYIKSGNCSSTGWTYIDDILSSATNSANLIAGVTYYILIDDENTTSSSGDVTINCPQPAVNPCNSISSLTCGSSANFSLSAGNGSWNPPGPWGTPGNEAVFEYTAPFTGPYDISVTNSGFYVDLFIKSGSCSSTGWTYIDDVFTTATNTVNLVAGTTYYFLIDDENTAASSGTINISCPCIPPPGGIDASYTYNGPLTISSTTVGACDDCSLRSSKDRVYEINIPCSGNYTFTTCSGTSWDTYLYLRTAACGGNLIALNDDACGLQSSITATLNPGAYYIHVEGFSSLSEGAFDLAISGTLDIPVIGAIVGPTQVCENAGGVGYSVSGNFNSFNWTVPSDATIISGANSSSIVVNFGATSGNVAVTASNNCGTNASSQSVVVKPTPDFNVSVQDVACFGGNDGSIQVQAVVGDAPFTYYLDGQSSNNNSFDQLTAGTYTISIMDNNGCISNNQSVTVSEPTLLNLQLDGCSVVYANLGNEYACATINSTVSGGTASYTYLWSNGETTANIIVCPDSTASYSLNVTDNNGCSTSDTFVVRYVDISCTPNGCSSNSSSSNSSNSSSSSNSGSSSSGSSNAFSQPPACSQSINVPTINWVPQPSRVVSAGQVLCINGNGVYYGAIQVLSGGHVVVCGTTTIYGSVTINPGANYWHSPNTGFVGSLAFYGNEYINNAVCNTANSTSSSGISYPSAPSCSSNSSSNSGSGSGSNSSSNSSSASCSIPSYSSGSSSASGSSSGSPSGSSSSSSSGPSSSSGSSSSSNSSISCSSNSSSNSSSAKNSKIQMCLNGITYCIKRKDIDKKILCGYTLGPCNVQQESACAIPTSNPSTQVCGCSAPLTNLRLRYIGPSFVDVTAFAKKNCITIGNAANLTTGDYINISAASGGLSYLKKHSYLTANTRQIEKVKIPTNCCETVVGNVYYPYEIVGWIDADGNTCGSVGISANRTNQSKTTDSGLSLIRQFPNPAGKVSTFEFKVPQDDEVDMSIVNVRGQVISTVFNGTVEADKTYQFTQDVSELQSGIYFIYLNTSKGVVKKKFVILK